MLRHRFIKVITNAFFQVDIRYKEAFHSCSSYDPWSCRSGNCGSKTYVSGRIDSSSKGGSWCQSEALMKRTVPNNSPFQLQ